MRVGLAGYRVPNACVVAAAVLSLPEHQIRIRYLPSMLDGWALIIRFPTADGANDRGGFKQRRRRNGWIRGGTGPSDD